MIIFRKLLTPRALPGYWQNSVRRRTPLLVLGLIAAAPLINAAEPAEVQKGLLAGNYAAVIKQAIGELKDSPGNTDWSMLLVQALLTVGRNADADRAMKEALTRDARSIRLRWLARDVA